VDTPGFDDTGRSHGESLCGDDALKNVILVTTMWDKVRDEHYGQALRHEQELLNDFWKPMEEKGSYLAQFDGTRDSAFALVWQLAAKESVILDVQKETVDQDMDVLHTAAGVSLVEKLNVDKVEYELRLKKIESQMEKEEESGNNAAVKELRTQKSDVEAILRRIDRSINQMRVRPGSMVKARIKEVVTGRHVETAIGVLVAVLNITLFVVKMAIGG